MSSVEFNNGDYSQRILITNYEVRDLAVEAGTKPNLAFGHSDPSSVRKAANVDINIACHLISAGNREPTIGACVEPLTIAIVRRFRQCFFVFSWAIQIASAVDISAASLALSRE